MKNNFFFLSLMIFLLSSCAITIPNANFSVSDQHMSGSGYRVVKTVQGTASTPYVLNFIGGFGRTSLIERAREEALEEADLQPNQSLAFETINDKYSNFFVVGFRTVTFHAYVIEKGNSDITISTKQSNTTDIQKTDANSLEKTEHLEELPSVSSADLVKYRNLLKKFFGYNSLNYNPDEFYVKKIYNPSYVLMSNVKIDVELSQYQDTGKWKAKSRINGAKILVNKNLVAE